MRYQCPACQRTLDEAGFCPFDGTKLVELDKPTVVSAYVEAQPGEPTLEPPRVRAYSASENLTDAVAEIKARKSEYDRLVGETLDGRYFIERKLGEGGMGVVFAARHAVIERPLAIKVLKREVMRDEATIRRFVQEAKAASRIGHPNIVDVTDFGTTPDGLTYSVMEQVDGTTLGKAIKHGAPFPADRIVRIATQIARALGAAHDKRIVHRDLKPENVFLIDRDGRPDFVKIVDFGIAKVQPLEGSEAGPRLTRAGSVFGTPEYMAPEQASGRGDTDHRVDIYALGAIMYEMAVARVPLKGGSTVQTLAMVMLDPIVPPSQVNPDLAIGKPLELLIMKCLAKARDDRFATMAELVTALDRIAAGEPVMPAAATDVGAPRRAKPLTKPLHEPEFVTGEKPLSFDLPPPPAEEEPVRRRWPFVVLGLLLAAAAATAVVIAMRPAGSPQVAEARDARHADAPQVVELPADAAIVEEPAADAQVVAVVEPPHVVRDAGVTVHHPRTVRIQVLTRPGEATVHVDGLYRGPSQTWIEEKYGTTHTITCHAPHLRGEKRVTFDGSVSSIMCTAVRVPPCVKGLKPNPLDPQCEEDPTLHGPGDPMDSIP